MVEGLKQGGLESREQIRYVGIILQNAEAVTGIPQAELHAHIRDAYADRDKRTYAKYSVVQSDLSQMVAAVQTTAGFTDTSPELQLLCTGGVHELANRKVRDAKQALKITIAGKEDVEERLRRAQEIRDIIVVGMDRLVEENQFEPFKAKVLRTLSERGRSLENPVRRGVYRAIKDGDYQAADTILTQRSL